VTNEESDDVTLLNFIVADTTAPMITASLSSPANTAGWHKQDVTVIFTCSDAGSGIATCPAPVTVTSEGAGQNVSGTATDVAGNTAITSVVLNIDKTLPTINATLTPAANASGWSNNNVTVSFDCQDKGADITTCSAPITVTAEAANQIITGTVTDTAGNSATTMVTIVEMIQHY